MIKPDSYVTNASNIQRQTTILGDNTIFGIFVFYLHELYGQFIAYSNIIGASTFFYMCIPINIGLIYYFHDRYLPGSRIRIASSIFLLLISFLLSEIGYYTIYTLKHQQIFSIYLYCVHSVLFVFAQQVILIKVLGAKIPIFNALFYVSGFYDSFLSPVYFRPAVYWSQIKMGSQYETLFFTIFIMILASYVNNIRRFFSGNAFIGGAKLTLLNSGIILSCFAFKSAIVYIFYIFLCPGTYTWSFYLSYFYFMLMPLGILFSAYKLETTTKDIFWISVNFLITSLTFFMEDMWSSYAKIRPSLTVWEIVAFLQISNLFAVKMKKINKNILMHLFSLSMILFTVTMIINVIGMTKAKLSVDFY